MIFIFFSLFDSHVLNVLGPINWLCFNKECPLFMDTFLHRTSTWIEEAFTKSGVMVSKLQNTSGFRYVCSLHMSACFMMECVFVRETDLTTVPDQTEAVAMVLEALLLLPVA